MLIGRPQDFLIFLNPIRPALSLGILTVLLAIIQRSRLGTSHVLMSSQGKLYAALLCVIIMSIPFAYYRNGAFTFLATVYVNVAIFFVLFCRLVDCAKKIEQVLFVACLGSGLYSVVALSRGTLVGEGRLAFGEVFDPNDLAYFAVSFLPLNLLFLSKKNSLWKRLLVVGNILTSMMLILKTGSRGGFIALCLVACTILFTRMKSLKLSYKIIIVILGLFIVFAGASKTNFSRFGTIIGITDDYNTWDESGRVSIWKKGFALMLSHPLTGVGVSCFNEAIGQERRKQGLPEKWQAPHNSLVQIGTETGVVGFFLFLIISYNVLKIFGAASTTNSTEQIKGIGGIAKIGFLGNITAAMFLSQAYSIYWVLFVALSMAIQWQSQKQVSV